MVRRPTGRTRWGRRLRELGRPRSAAPRRPRRSRSRRPSKAAVGQRGPRSRTNRTGRRSRGRSHRSGPAGCAAARVGADGRTASRRAPADEAMISASLTELVAEPVVAVGVGVEHGRIGRGGRHARHPVEHVAREREIEQRVDEERGASPSTEAGVGPPPAAVRLEPGAEAVTEIVETFGVVTHDGAPCLREQASHVRRGGGTRTYVWIRAPRTPAPRCGRRPSPRDTSCGTRTPQVGGLGLQISGEGDPGATTGRPDVRDR